MTEPAAAARPLTVASRARAGSPLVGRVAVGVAILAVGVATVSVVRAQRVPAGVTRWYGVSPHVPFVEGNASGDLIAPDHGRACRAWSQVGSTWTALDRWGQILGPRRLANRSYYDVTRCYEAEFPDDPASQPEPWHPATVALYVQGAWRPGPSAAWTPDAGTRAAHRRFVATLTDALLDPSVTATPSDPSDTPLALEDRTLFFQVADPGDRDNQIPPRNRRLAVSGGRVLLVTEQTVDGRWFAPFVRNDLGVERGWTHRAYLPVAVVDMNHDGWPEIVCHELEGGGEFYGDVLVTHTPQGTWELTVRSVGGSTA